MKLSMIMNIFYQPCTELKREIDQHRDVYVPVNGGASLSACGDSWVYNNVWMDSGPSSISDKNRILNENTSLWFAWKNLIFQTDYVGFCNYRRIFDLDHLELDNCDAAVFNRIPTYFCGHLLTLKQHYACMHYGKDFELFVSQLQRSKVYDREIFELWINEKFLFAPCNSFILKKELFQNYCEDAFDVMLPLVDKINLKGRSNYQQRALAFLFERFMSYWCFRLQVQARVKEVRMVLHEDWKPQDAVDSRTLFGDQVREDDRLQHGLDLLRKWGML